MLNVEFLIYPIRYNIGNSTDRLSTPWVLQRFENYVIPTINYTLEISSIIAAKADYIQLHPLGLIVYPLSLLG